MSEQRGHYNVTLVHDLFTIQTLVTADSEEDAIKTAEQFFTQDQGLPQWVADDHGGARAELEAVL